MDVLTERRGAIWIIALNRPARRNAVDEPSAVALRAAFAAFEADTAAAVAILTGNGGTFCAGADLKALAEGRGLPSLEPDAPGPMGPTRERLAKPVIAAVEGYAVAGGLELALWCDLRVAARNAVFGVFSRRFGVPLIDGGTVRLPRLIGQGRALDMILTGRPVDAEEAFRIGLVDRLAEPGRALADSIALAEQIAAFPQASLMKDRASVLRQWSLDLPAALREEAKGAEAILTREGFAGAARFGAGAGRHGSFEDFEQDAKKEDKASHAGPLL